MIRNALAASCLEWGGRNREVVARYLEGRAAAAHDPDSLKRFEREFRGGSYEAEFFCVVTGFCNDRPYLAAAGTLTFCINLVAAVAFLAKRLT
jgi:hypothetical protein